MGEQNSRNKIRTLGVEKARTFLTSRFCSQENERRPREHVSTSYVTRAQGRPRAPGPWALTLRVLQRGGSGEGAASAR